MPSKAKLARLGIFVIICAALVVAMAAAFLGIELFERKHRYLVRVPDASGLEVGSAVQVRGVRVGSVSDIDLYREDRESVVLTLAVEPDVSINQGAQAFLEFKGVTGLKVIDIRGGTGKGILKPGSYIPLGESTLDTLRAQAEVLMQQVSGLLANTSELVGSLERVTRELDLSRVDDVLQKADRMMEHLAETSADVRETFRNSRQPFQRSVENAALALEQIDMTAETADQMLENLNRIAVELQSVVRTNDAQVRATLYNLRQATQNFQVLSRELRQQPRRLLFSNAPPERELP